ncbi:MAG: hypothetical protein SVM80_04285 [Halobacteriota archaeon]|nr:hypothetical protein [Halobacteriota archaeon]
MKKEIKNDDSHGMKEGIKTFLKLCALFIPLYFTFVIYSTFLDAFFNPVLFDLMRLNIFGDVNFEFVMMPICIVSSIAGIVVWLTEGRETLA